MLPQRIVAVGDIHGNFDAFRQIFTALELVDDKLQWAAEDTTLVQIGDVCDRGNESRRVYELLMNWQETAPLCASQVIVLLGNHEVMEMFGFDRDASLEEIQGYADQPDSPGYLEHRKAFMSSGWLHEWLLGQAGIVQFGPVIFGHGDLPVSFQDRTVDEINQEIIRDIRAHASRPADSTINLPASLFSEDESLVWCRQSRNTETYVRALESFLRRNHGAIYVCGHTPSVDGRFAVKGGGRYLCIDTAMGFENRGIGRRTALVIEDGRAWQWTFSGKNVGRRKVPVRLDSL
ncbi:MAG TPA: metallophosphoesterase family protein [Spirochaetia bacterium]|nr:metallophosphoesterase family protein [Spirochaetia bacterium]